MLNWVILFLSFTLITEATAWRTESLYKNISYWFYVISLSTSSFQTVSWICYFDYKIYGDIQALKKRLKYYAVAPAAILSLMVYNFFRPGIVFEIDQAGTIVWGWGSWLPPVIVYVLILASLWFFLKNRNMIEGRLTQILLVFIVLPIFGSIIQQFTEDIPVNWAMYTLALLMTFISVEMLELYRDELTNLATRRQLENRLQFKLKNKAPFFVVMMDLDNFKSINDTRGHLEGDRVLQAFADILITSINPEDFACRVGGDEFMLIIESREDHVMHEVIQRINMRVEEFKKEESFFELGVSIGVEKVETPESYDLDGLQRSIDSKMYEHKKMKKQR